MMSLLQLILQRDVYEIVFLLMKPISYVVSLLYDKNFVFSSMLTWVVSNNAESIVSYLRLTYSNPYFASTILKILIEDRRYIHVERINDNRNIDTMHPGDRVIAHTVVQSDKATDEVTKFCHAVRGLFQNFSWCRSWWLHCLEIK